MNPNHCPHEASLLAALASGCMPNELSQHVASCAVCQDVRLIWAHLHECAEEDAHAALPSSGVIWWRAELAKKRAAAQRSVAAISIMQSIALAAVIAGLLAIAVWQSSRLAELPLTLLAGSAATVLVLIASLIVVFNSARPAHGRRSPGGM